MTHAEINALSHLRRRHARRLRYRVPYLVVLAACAILLMYNAMQVAESLQTLAAEPVGGASLVLSHYIASVANFSYLGAVAALVLIVRLVAYWNGSPMEILVLSLFGSTQAGETRE